MSGVSASPVPLPSIHVDVVEPGVRAHHGWLRCEIGQHLRFESARLEAYCLASWEPIVFDAFLLAAAIQFCDQTKRRPASGWGREIRLRIPVHDPNHWNSCDVNLPLHDTLDFLTGDCWTISFTDRKEPISRPRQGHFSIPDGSCAIISFSDGLDSRAVAGLMEKKLGDRLIRVRLGSKGLDQPRGRGQRHPFASVPFRVRQGEKRFVETSARSRGFKFTLLSGVAAYLMRAEQVVVPESGQGALGSSLVPVGQGYADYRNHPLFTERMEVFLLALLRHQVRFTFPRLWHTKGETLAEFVAECPDGVNWANTWSCWQSSRQVSISGRKRQCGVCAACMLRRLTVHAAGLTENNETYVWEDLHVERFEAGAAPEFHKVTDALRQYAIAGVLHLDHLADLRHSSANARGLGRKVFQLSRSLNLPKAETQSKMDRLLEQHEREWKSFILSLGANSFIAHWALRAQ